MSLVKSKLNKIEALIAKALISNFNSNFSHNEIVLINNVLKEYVEMKQEVKNLKTWTVHQRFLCIYKTMLSYCLKCRKNTESKNLKKQE